ncbi:MAG: dienelactone hydrolase [Verrucomicrobiales bacterium]|jgi:dienelactone hydrolase
MLNGMIRLSLLSAASLFALTLRGNCQEEFQIQEVSVTASGVQLSYPSEEGFYYILYKGSSVDELSTAIALAAHSPTESLLTDRNDQQGTHAFYRIHKLPIENSLDLDGDGIKDIAELNYPGILDPLESRDAVLDFDNDGKTNIEELNDPSGATDPGDAVFQEIEFKTVDDFTIAASLGVPRTLNSSIPAVIFIHQGGSTRQEWQSVAEQAFREGWATLAYDIRGHGKSSGQWTNAWYDDPDNAPEDLKSAIQHMKALPEVDAQRVAVVGSSVGGNLACVASALYDIKTAVAMSHKTSAVRNLAGAATLPFNSIYHLSSAGDQSGQRAKWATELFELTTVPKKLEITTGSGHGVAIFRTDRSVPDRIIQWLRDTL